VLINSGSTHSFLDEETSFFQCEMQETTLLSVMIANESRMVSHYKCKEFRWMMGGHEFAVDLRILKLGGCHIILGVDWMRTVSPSCLTSIPWRSPLIKAAEKLLCKGARK